MRDAVGRTSSKTKGSRELRPEGRADKGAGCGFSLFPIPDSRSQSPPAFVPACLRDLSMSTRATLDNGPLIPPFHQTPRDGRGYSELQSFRSLRVARGYTINRFAAMGEVNP